jgi:hypothetical protein
MMIKKLGTILIFLAFLVGCSTFQRIDDLERKATVLEGTSIMDEAAGVGAPIRMFGRDCVDGSCAAGFDLDDLTGMVDGDGAVVPKDPTYGFLIYEYDDPSSTGDDPPWVIDPDSGTGEWILMGSTFESVFGKMEVSKETGATVTVNHYDTGTHFINDDDDDIEFDLPSDPTELVFCFGDDQDASTATSNITIDPDAADFIIFKGVVAAAGEALISQDDAKDLMCLIGLDSSYWKVISHKGAWAEASP